MALAHCILGKFLGVVCHCFPPPLDVPTFAARCLYVRNDARDPSSERWNYVLYITSVNFREGVTKRSNEVCNKIKSLIYVSTRNIYWSI